MIPDPRTFPDLSRADPRFRRCYEFARTSLDAGTAIEAVEPDRELRAELASMLRGDAAALARLIADAPSVDVARQLWRTLDAVWMAGGGRTEDGLAGPVSAGTLGVTLFALPVVVVAGRETGGGSEAGPTVLPTALTDTAALVRILRDGDALRGNQTFALADRLVGPESLALVQLPAWWAWLRRLEIDGPVATPGPEELLRSATIELDSGPEAVHLRFVIGSAVAKAGVDLLADTAVGRWGVPLAREIGRQLAVPPATVLALPRLPQRPLPALQAGRVAQRDVSAAVFVGNALRGLRAAVGEPTAVLSAHSAPGVPGGGELRLSLSSPLAPKEAEGFRCPLYPFDRVSDVARGLVDLLRECRVGDIRVLAGIYADRDPATGLRLLFKPETIPLGAV